ncbi:hypothetical protein ASG01_00245 [Chryseobacterium sp. Leaf180]|nr:hypothetical protein ASG01_00245 [Chryseobacterium sp. Leaf180]
MFFLAENTAFFKVSENPNTSQGLSQNLILIVKNFKMNNRNSNRNGSGNRSSQGNRSTYEEIYQLGYDHGFSDASEDEEYG